MNTRIRFRPVLIAVRIGLAVLLAVGLFGLGVLLDQLVAPVHGMAGQPVLPAPAASQPSSATGGGAFSGTLASFTALIPENLGIYLPLISH